MCNSVYMLAVGIAFTLVYASSQAGNPTSSTNLTAGQSQAQSAEKQSGSSQKEAPAGEIGSKASAAAPSAIATGASETQTATTEAVSSSEMQTQIQNALRNEPTLVNDSVSVAVSDEEITVSGTVASTKEKLTAQRIVQSYAGNRRLKDHLKVSARNQDNLSNPKPNTQNPARNPDQNTNTPLSGSKPPNK